MPVVHSSALWCFPCQTEQKINQMLQITIQKTFSVINIQPASGTHSSMSTTPFLFVRGTETASQTDQNETSVLFSYKEKSTGAADI